MVIAYGGDPIDGQRQEVSVWSLAPASASDRR
jgi:hypothetical protein